MPLVPCDLRVDLDDEYLFFRRQTSMNSRDNLVNASICHACPVRPRPCADCRPVPRSIVAVRTAPSVGQEAWNMAQGIVSFVADGARTVNRAVDEARLQVRESRDEPTGNTCRQCGCRLSLKAPGQVFHCPLDEWPKEEE